MNYARAVQFSLPTAFDLECCICQIGLAHDVVAVNDAAAFVATDSLGYSFGGAGSSPKTIRKFVLSTLHLGSWPPPFILSGRTDSAPAGLPLCRALAYEKKLKLPEYFRVGNQTMKADEA